MREALGAKKDWSSNGFSKLQRGISRIILYEQDDVATLEKINKTREELGLQRREPGNGMLMRNAFGTKMALDTLTYVIAEDDSIVDWKTCMSEARERAKQVCTNSGGTFYEGELTTIVKDGPRITALILEDGGKIDAIGALVVLAVGPWLAQALAASDITPHRTKELSLLPGYSRTLSS